MFRPKKMSKLAIIGEKSFLPAVIDTLHKLNALHIVEHKRTDELDIGKPLDNSEKLSEVILRLRSIISHLGIQDTSASKGSRLVLKKLGVNIEKLSKQVSSLIERKKDLDSKIKYSSKEIDNLYALDSLSVSFELLSDYESIVYYLGYIQNLDILKLSLNEQGIDYELKSSSYDNRKAIALFVNKSKQHQTQEILSKCHFSTLDFSKYSRSKVAPKSLAAKLTRELKQHSKDLASLDKEITALRGEWSRYLVDNEFLLREAIKKSEVPLRFGSTDNAFFITGFVPREDVERVVEALQQISKNSLFIQEQQISHHESIPIKFQNSDNVSPFQFFLNLYSLPSYYELDPSFLLFIGFPLMFGFMLGDFGYGFTTLALFYLLKKKFNDPGVKQFFQILIWASLWTIIFGFLFGEFYGKEILFGFDLPRILSREHQKMLLLGTALVIGALHVNLGIIIGFYNELKHHGFWHAFCAKLSWIILQLGVALLYMSYGMYMIAPIFGFIAVGIAVILLYLGEGVSGIVELPAIFGNILSYARLMAIGLASVGLAVVVNDLAAGFFESPTILNILMGIFVLVIGHVVNIFLGILGPFLHSLRLQYVEFFTKFYQGGGIQYEPFGEDKS